MRAAGRRVLLAKAIEHVRQERGVDAFSGIGHDDATVGRGRRDGDLDRSALDAEFDRVGDQVADDLLHAVRVDVDRHRRIGFAIVELQTLRFGGGAQRFEPGADQRAHVLRDAVEGDLSGDHSRDVEQVVDQLRLCGDVAVEHLQRPAPHVPVVGGPPQHRQPPDDRGQGSAQLVREHGEKLVLRPARLRFGGHLFERLALRRVAEDQHHAHRVFARIADRRAAVVDRQLGPVAPQQDGVVGQADDDAGAQHLEDGTFHRLPRLLVDDAEDVVERPAARLGRRPAG